MFGVSTVLAKYEIEFTGDRGSGTRSEWLRWVNEIRGTLTNFETALLATAPVKGFVHVSELYHYTVYQELEDIPNP